MIRAAPLPPHQAHTHARPHARTIVYVLPLPVAPYANTVVLMPYSTPLTRSRTVPLYTSVLDACNGAHMI